MTRPSPASHRTCAASCSAAKASISARRADLSELSERTVYEGVLHSRMWHATLDKVQYAPVPVVAGAATIGGGLEIAAAAHIRVAERSHHGLPEGERGLGGGSMALSPLIGNSRMTQTATGCVLISKNRPA